MAGNVKLDLHIQAVQIKVDSTNDATLNALAEQIEGQTKINISDLALVDTGFYRNSVVALPVGSRGVPAEDAVEINREGYLVDRHADMLPAMGRNEAGVGIGAEYGAILEAKYSPLYSAAEEVAGQAGLTVERVASQHGLR